jgi:hypothetical protein
MLCILYSQSSFSFFYLEHFVQPLLRIMGWTIEYLIVLIATSKRRFADLVTMAIFIVHKNARRSSASNHCVLSGDAIKIHFAANYCMLLAKRNTGKRRK